MPHDPKDDIANEWFNELLAKLRFEQDYYIFPGTHKDMLDKDGEKEGIEITRADVRLYSTGVRKLYDMIVVGIDLPKTEYTDLETKAQYDQIKKRFPEAF